MVTTCGESWLIAVGAAPSAELWTTTEARGDALAAVAGEHEAVVRAARGHLELCGVTTVAALSATTTLPADDLVVALAALERAGFAMQGHYRGSATVTEWVARRLLARMHSYSKRARRHGFEAITAQDFMRFLLRWQHVAADTQLSGEAGLVEILEQLQGFEAAASTWESELFSRRLRHYDPAWLDGLCHTGEVAWLRLTPRTYDEATSDGHGVAIQSHANRRRAQERSQLVTRGGPRRRSIASAAVRYDGRSTGRPAAARRQLPA